jgi:predicted secreted protein
MFKELFITVEEVEANHRALRRCRSCGSYERPYETFNGGVRCERCAKKARRQRERESEDLSEDLNVRFTV